MVKIKFMNKLEVNKKIALFNGDITSMSDEKDMSELNYTESWDKLIPVYQKLCQKSKELYDKKNVDGFLYINHCIENDLDLKASSELHFAIALVSVIDEYYCEIK